VKLRSSSKHLSPGITLWRLGVKQTLKGAIIIGILIGLMGGVQGVGYAKTYPDNKSRAAFATTFESAPALGILYGETKNLASAAGYMVYRTVPIMALIAAIWGLMTVTKLVRGQEEDGRWEVVTSGNTTSRQALWLIMSGFATSLFVAFAIAGLIIAVIGVIPVVNMSFFASLLIALAIFLPAGLFATIGMFTSQLSLTRRRATVYGLIPLAVFFALRSIGNVLEDFYWLKDVTPFGWSDQISPVFDPQIVWLLPFSLFIPLFIAISIYLVGQRDLGASLLPESNTAKPHYALLGSPATLALRQNLPLFFGWGVLALTVSVLISAVMTVAAEAVAESPSLGAFLSQLGGSTNDLKIAFLGAGMVFVVMILLTMATTSLASIRQSEAKSYLDNILTQPVRRSSWLVSRLLIIIIGFTLISIICSLATWAMAQLQGISLDLGNVLLVSIALIGTVVLTLGFGTLLYGILPRIAAIGMYVVISWSFLIDIIGSVIKLDDFIVKSSLFHYMSLSVAEAPDWQTFAWLLSIGIVMAAIGVVAFTKRDIVAE
jgi:ABC-2 type transport system permease protein